jgi:pyridoxine 4-dehydrogenase
MSKELILPAAASGTLTIGNDLTVNQIGYGAMRITGPGIWGSPADKEAALATLRAVSRSCRSYGILTFNQI